MVNQNGESEILNLLKVATKYSLYPIALPLHFVRKQRFFSKNTLFTPISFILFII